MVARRTLLWARAISLAVRAAASVALLWLRTAEDAVADAAGPDPGGGAGERAGAAPLADIATAIGIDEDDGRRKDARQCVTKEVCDGLIEGQGSETSGSRRPAGGSPARGVVGTPR